MKEEMSKTWVISLLLIGTLSVSAQNIQQNFLHVAPKTMKPPVVDGLLDDVCWKAAPEFESQMPKTDSAERGRTVTKILWDDKGVYLGVVNYQKNLDSLKANIKSRDGGDVWADDSNEYFISPTLSNISYYKFDINSLGVFSDWYKQDASLEYHGWNAVDAKAAAGRIAGAWVIEMFVSWKDLQYTAKEGEFIGFQLNRFEWDGGSYKRSGNTGGSFFSVNMAFVYLSPQDIPPMLEIAKQVDRLVPRPWFIAADARNWFYSDKKNVFNAAPGDIVSSMCSIAAGALKDIEKQIASDTDKSAYDELRKRFEKAGEQKDAGKAVFEYGALIAKAKLVLSELELQSMLD